MVHDGHDDQTKSKQLFGDPSDIVSSAHRVVTWRRQHLYGRFQRLTCPPRSRAFQARPGIAARGSAPHQVRPGHGGGTRRHGSRAARGSRVEFGRLVAGAIARATKWRTLAFHKPRGIVTTRRDPQGRRTVFDVRAERRSLVAVGRLDLASTGLLLLTTDTQLAARLTDPRNQVIRRYVVTARGAVSDDAARAMERGRGGPPGTCRRGSEALEPRDMTHHRIDRRPEPRNPPPAPGGRARGHETAEGRLRTDRARNASAGRVEGSHA